MHSDRSLIATRSLANAASVLIPLQDLLSQTAEVFLIMTFECVAGCAKTHSRGLSSNEPWTAGLLDLAVSSSFPLTCGP